MKVVIEVELADALDMLAAVHRECKRREFAYPHKVARHEMSAENAAEERRRMDLVARHIEAVYRQFPPAVERFAALEEKESSDARVPSPSAP